VKEEKEEEMKPEPLSRAYDLLSKAERGNEVTVRDDQCDFFWLLDTAKLCRRRGVRFRLIDSGALEFSQLEWLAKAGADLYTSDRTRCKALELELLNKACRESGGFMAIFLHGWLESTEGEEKPAFLSFQELLNLASSGVFLHLSNKDQKRDFSHLISLAYFCSKGGSWLVYYHHGPMEDWLEELGRSGAWIHLSDQSIEKSKDQSLILNTIKSAQVAGTNLVLYLEKGLETHLLQDIVGAGAFLQFDLTQLVRQRHFRTILKGIKGRSLDYRAYYLYHHFLP
jgi:hypothetical protein